MEDSDDEDEEPVPEVLTDTEVGKEAVGEDFELAGEISGAEQTEGGGAAGEQVHQGAKEDETNERGNDEAAFAGGK